MWFVAAESLLVPDRRRDTATLTATIGYLRSELREQRREIQRLRVENEVLREAAEPLVHHAPAHERFGSSHRLRERFGGPAVVPDPGNRSQATTTRGSERRSGARSVRLTFRCWYMIVEIHTAYPVYGPARHPRAQAPRPGGWPPRGAVDAGERHRRCHPAQAQKPDQA